MNTASNFVSDRRSVANLNALSSGIPVVPANLRDASNRAGPSDAYVQPRNLSVARTQAPLPLADPGNGRLHESYVRLFRWSRAVDPYSLYAIYIDRRARQATRARPLASMNPFGGGLMQDNLHTTRAGKGFGGNHTAARTILGGGGSGSGGLGLTGAFGGHNSNNSNHNHSNTAKRQKTAHSRESQFFENGGEWLGGEVSFARHAVLSVIVAAVVPSDHRRA